MLVLANSMQVQAEQHCKKEDTMSSVHVTQPCKEPPRNSPLLCPVMIAVVGLPHAGKGNHLKAH